MKKEYSHIKNGFSLVEVMLSIAVFVLLVTALTGAYLYGEESTMLAGNRAKATMLAEEGLEATRNIRDPQFVNLVDGTYGLATTSNQYNLSGASDTDGFFTRSINVATFDSKRKDITSTVTWQQNPQRTGSVSLVTRLTNWIASGGAILNSLLVYGDGTTVPKTRSYDNTANTFSAASSTATSSSGTTFIVRTSPKKAEAITGFVNAAGVLTVMCYDGVTWNQEWTATVGGTGTTRRFDISYETNSGNVIVLYSNNIATTNELSYRTKNNATGCGAANWSVATSLDPVRTTGIVQWVKMAWDKRSNSNLITAIWADANADLSTMVWEGSTWTNEPTAASETSLEVLSVAQDVEDFDVEYESLSGDVMMVWANSAGSNAVNGVRYRTCTGGIAACTWGAVTTPPNFLDDATNLDISANPNTDEIVFASIGNAGSDLQIGYWSGSVWTDTANVDTSAQIPLAGTKLVATGWLISGATTRSIVTYNDSGSTNIGYYVGNAGVFTVQTDFTVSPVLASPQKYYQIEMNPLSKDQLMFCLSDNASDLHCKRLVMSSTPAFTWSNSATTALTLTLPQLINSPFSFAFLRN
jgi:prepilin-type N-terminal cleavage/methylation domain-containing protein